ncbi:serine/arginine repetitive matrix protein 1-like [Manduca sexta]|uniref:serine/arginine repetitive matrix protein 1-like n=1 Tax=Manduca sexta TaxID=7130 RepID=UPI00188EDB6D|nr:serine/arginine repetitive matrix protein 1-like [Manduca sexta]
MKAMKEENATLKRRLEDLEASANKSSTEEMLAMVGKRGSKPAHEEEPPPGTHNSRDERIRRRGAEPKTGQRQGKRKKGAAQPAPAPAPPSLLQSLGPPVRRHNPSRVPPRPRRLRRASTARPRTEERDAETKAPKGQEERTSSPARSRARVLPPAPANVDTPWVEVVRRRSRQQRQQTTQPPPKPTRRKEPKLRPPRSAAVVISHTSSNCEGPEHKSVLTGRPK